jgi:hypothetical protein
MNVFDEVARLNLPSDQFIVLGSGILGALGIRDIGDVDLLVTPELFEQLRDNGWHHEIVTIEGRERDKLSAGPVEAFKDCWWAGKSLDPHIAVQHGEIINGVRFLPLTMLMDAKRSMAREKDFRDITLIEAYLANA